MQSVWGVVPADVVVVRRVEHPLELSSQPQAVRVLARVRVVEEQNHQQEKHINQEILKNKKDKDMRDREGWEGREGRAHAAASSPTLSVVCSMCTLRACCRAWDRAKP